MAAIGIDLAQSGVFGHPYVVTMDTGPTAVVPPLFPAFIGMLIKALGYSGAWWALAIWLVVIQGLHASLLPQVSRVFYADETPGIYAAVLSIILPVLSWMPYWDAMYSAAGLMFFFVFSDRLLRSQRKKLAALVSGFCSGLLALLNPSSLLVSAPWFLFLVRRTKRPFRSCLPLSIAYIAAVCLAVLPWSIRNSQVLGTPSLKTNLGMTLFASNNDCASSSAVANLESGCYAAHHPYGSLAEAALSKRMGEAAYDRYRLESAMQWARSHFTQFSRLTVQRIIEFWFPNPINGYYGGAIGLVTALSAPGLWLMIRRRIQAIALIATVFALYPCLYYLVVSDYRYRYPILWLSLLPAGYCLLAISDRLHLGRWKPRTHGSA
jgi:hypothetical protein